MNTAKDKIISSDNLDEVFGKFLLGDYLVMKRTCICTTSPFYNSWVLFFAWIDKDMIPGEELFPEDNFKLEIIPNIDLSKIYKPAPGGFGNLRFKESKNDFERMIMGPFYFSKEYIAKLLNDQFGYKPNE